MPWLRAGSGRPLSLGHLTKADRLCSSLGPVFLGPGGGLWDTGLKSGEPGPSLASPLPESGLMWEMEQSSPAWLLPGPWQGSHNQRAAGALPAETRSRHLSAPLPQAWLIRVLELPGPAGSKPQCSSHCGSPGWDWGLLLHLLPSLTTGFSQGPPSVWARSPSLARLPRSRPHTGGESTCCQLLTVQLLLPEQEHQVLVGGWPVRTSLPCAHWGALVAGDLSLVRPRPGHLGAQMKLPLSVRLGQMTSPRARVCFPWSDTQASHFPLPAPAPAFKAGTPALPLSNPISLCVIQLYGSRCVTDF